MSEREYRQANNPGAASGKEPRVSIWIPARNSGDSIGYVIENRLNQLPGILLEICRISKRIILLQGEVSNLRENAATRNGFKSLFAMMKTGEITRLNL